MVGVRGHEEAFPREHTLARAHELCEEALLLPVAVTEDGVEILTRVPGDDNDL